MEPNSEKQNTDQFAVEDFLRLKRYEKPDPAYWERFEREIEKKRLLVLVKKDPWYVRLAHIGLQRLYPLTALGAAAAVVFGWVAFQNASYSPPGTEYTSGAVVASTPAEDNQAGQAAGPSREALPEQSQPSFLVAAPSSEFLATARTPTKNDFGLDVIAPRPQTYRFQRFTTDMQPTAFRVSEKSTIRYGKDTLSPNLQGSRVRVGAALF